MRKFFILAVACIGLLGIGSVLINFLVVHKTAPYVYVSMEEIPDQEAVIILGAKVNEDRLSFVLEDRVIPGVELYSRGTAPKILVSGDHGQKEYDEVNAMRKYILNSGKGVDEADLFLDHAGFDTYDSLYRAKEIFGVRKAVIVTQAFHIHRAVYIARALGIDAVGYAVSQEHYPDRLTTAWNTREYFTRIKAFKDVMIHAKPKYLGDPIPITGDGRASWDEGM